MVADYVKKREKSITPSEYTESNIDNNAALQIKTLDLDLERLPVIRKTSEGNSNTQI